MTPITLPIYDDLEAIKAAAKQITQTLVKHGGKPVGLYVYRDAQGQALYARYRVDTSDSKQIRPFIPIGGDWAKVEMKEPPKPSQGKPLYGLHLLALYPAHPVYIVEGEKCADSLQRLGLLAITSGGATSAKDADWQALNGRDVIIWADNDPAGQQYAAEVAACLAGLAATIKTIDVAALNLPAKGDCVDWLSAFEQTHGRKPCADDLRALALLPAQNNLPEINPISTESAPTLLTKPQTDDEAIAWLSSLKPMEYDRIRKEQAKALGVQVSTLDDLVKTARNEESESERLPFARVEPHPEPVNPAELLNEVSHLIRRFIVLEPVQADAAALWVAFTWFVDVVAVAPLAIINAPEKACGKSQLLDLMGRLSAKPLPASNSTAAGLFRAVELWEPTVLIDEADTFIRENDELKGLINAGHTRANAFVLRVVGDNHEPKLFKVWGAKALAGIALEKHLPDATMSRAIIFELRRKLPHESVTRLRHAEGGLFDGVAAKLARFAEDYAQQVRQARPTLPDELGDRAQDNWEPLLAIAGCAGTEWLQRATVAALTLSGAGDKTVSTGNELLADIQEIFENKRLAKISTADLIKALTDDDEKSWATYNRGKSITARQIATRLNGYGIKSKTVRIGYGTAKGFELDQFTDAFTRYLGPPLNLPSQGNNSCKPNTEEGLDVTDGNNVTVTQSEKVTCKPNTDGGCDVVTDKNGGAGGENIEVEL
ncbi:DUF3631 domain-containing protein [Parvibium lacunae]|uniref:DUF3631 domain-containing protein n=1 Tax=Parvibium lacunae TaxID=1888893 RepID=A0A368L7R0_9BURK|nr:DUF3631 domain-containing protein [Parvibium lacunae]RCS59592.1 DUF3631 domain-containing protein [Parvibium lacunae]